MLWHQDMATMKDCIIIIPRVCLISKQKHEYFVYIFWTLLSAYLPLSCETAGIYSGSQWRIGLLYPALCVALSAACGHLATMRHSGKRYSFFPPKLPDCCRALTAPAGDVLVNSLNLLSDSNLSLDLACQRPALSSCWCLTLRLSDSGPSDCGPSRLAVRRVEKAPVWRSWLTMRLSVGLLPQIRLGIKRAYHRVSTQA